MSSFVSQFNVSLTVWAKSRDTVHKTTIFEEKRKESRSGSNQGPSAYQPSALPLGHTGSQVRLLSDVAYIDPNPPSDSAEWLGTNPCTRRDFIGPLHGVPVATDRDLTSETVSGSGCVRSCSICACLSPLRKQLIVTLMIVATARVIGLSERNTIYHATSKSLVRCCDTGHFKSEGNLNDKQRNKQTNKDDWTGKVEIR